MLGNIAYFSNALNNSLKHLLSLLYNYVEEKIKVLRSIGIRGAIELMELCDEAIPGGTEMTKLVAEKLGQEPIAANKLRQTLKADPQVDLVWELWGGVWDEKNKQAPADSGDISVGSVANNGLVG
jgi:hypothetical protein